MSFKEYASKEYVNAAKELVTLKDIKTGYHYAVFIEDGKLSILQKFIGIEVSSLPNKIGYLKGEEFQPDGMEISLISEDGARMPINDYTYERVEEEKVIISYQFQSDVIFTTELKLEIFDLIDFYYTENEDGTYTINGWKQTYKGVSSTEMIVPNAKSIRI